MVNVNDDDDADVVEEKEEETTEEVVNNNKCDECNGTGAVPDNIVKGKADTYKDCTKCGGKGTVEPVPEPVDE